MARRPVRSKRPMHWNMAGLADLIIPVLDYPDPPLLHCYLPHEHLRNDLIVLIAELWPDAAADENAFDVLWLEVAVNGSPKIPPYHKRLDGPISLEFPFPIVIPKEYLEDGHMQIRYVIRDQDNIESPSNFRDVLIDTTPPNGNVQAPPVGLPTGRISEAYLAANPTVNIEVPEYHDRKAHDRVYYYVSRRSPPPDASPDGFFEFPELGMALVVPIPGRMFRKFPNGTQYVHIVLADRSNNRGPRSDQSAVLVELDESPIGLKAPVFQAMLNGSITLDDARALVYAKVEYDNWQVGDYIHLQYAGEEVTPFRVTTATSLVPVVWKYLIAAGEGPAADFARYHVTKGLDGDPSQPSPSTAIHWNFTTAGDPNRDAPALINDDYEKAILFGEGSQTDNYLDSRDKGQRIYARVELYNRPESGELLELYIDNYPHMGVPVARYVVNTDAGDTGGSVIEFSNIDWSVFEALGNVERFNTYYSTFNGVNEQVSPAQSVTFDNAPALVLERADFISAIIPGYVLNCLAMPPLWDHIPIMVPHHILFREDDKIVLEWKGYEEIGGENFIPGTEDVLEKILTQADIDAATAGPIKGYVLRQDKYETKIKPIKSPLSSSAGSSASAIYSVMRGDRILGTSRIRFVRVSRRSGLVWCGPEGDGPE